MTVTKIIINKEIDDKYVEIKDDNFFYLTRVLRHKRNDIFFIIGSKNYYLAKIISIEKDKLIAEIQESRQIKDINFNINLLFSLLKGEKNDLIIKAGTQYGVKTFHPVLMKRTVIKLSSTDREKKRERFQRIAGDMARESFLGFVPEISKIQYLNEKIFPEGLKLLFYEEEDLRDLSSLSKEIKNSKSVSLFFGPEGGITKDEYEYLVNQGFIPITLGERMLKAEFAIIAGINFVSFIKEGKIL